MRTGWYRPVHVKSFDGHRIRALLGARLQLVGMVTRISNHIRGVLKTFGLLPGGMRGKPFTERVEALVADRPDVAPIILPMLAARSKLREQIIAFDKAIRAEVKRSPACRLLMTARRAWGRSRCSPMSAPSRNRAGSPVPGLSGRIWG